MEMPEVIGILQELNAKDLEMLRGGRSEVNLGSKQGDLSAKLTESQLNGILDKLKQDSGKAFIINWNGGKIPREASINGKKIGWAQNGVVTSVDGKFIGTYERLMEFGGEKGNEQCMVVYTGQTADPLSD